MEYLIRRTDGDWFDIPKSSYSNVLHPVSLRSEQVSGWGDYRIRVEGIEIAFSYEDPGIQVVFEGDLPRDRADCIVREILKNIEEATGQRGRALQIA